MRKQERTRRAEETDPLIAADLDEHLAQLDQRIATFDRIIAETMRSDPALAPQAALLHVAALAAARSDTALGRFHQNLCDAGKPPKVALIALARKLLTTLNAILRQQIPFRQNAS
jgi:hypothetical protein